MTTEKKRYVEPVLTKRDILEQITEGAAPVSDGQILVG